MKLYTHPFSLIAWRVRIAAHEKGLACKESVVDVYSSRERSPELLRLNPFGQIPVLDDDGFAIAESIAILEYLEERYPLPPLMPQKPQARALARQFMCWSTINWPPAWRKWILPRMRRAGLSTPPVEGSPEAGRKEIAAHLDILEQRLNGRDWLVNDYSLADICYAPLVLVLDRVDLGGEIIGRAAVARWLARLNQRPSVQATMMMPPAPSSR